MTRRPSKAPASPDEPKRCGIYTRKSTSAGLDQAFTSLDAQREACVAYILRQAGWVVLDERYDDGGFTGANTERPALQRLLADIVSHHVDIVVVYKVDRLSRSLGDFVTVLKEFSAFDVGFVSVTQNFSTADAMGRLTMNMLMSFAEFEREMISERTRDKIAASRRKGLWTGGRVPLGYRSEGKLLVPVDREPLLVFEVFTTYLKLRSARAVAGALNERGRRTKHDRAWTRNDVLRILKQPVYAGYITSGGELHEGKHPAIIERSVFERVQAMLAAGTTEKAEAVRNPDYVLRGVLQCGSCGAAFTPKSTRTRGKVHRYYCCMTREQQGRKACAAAPLPAGAIENYVVDRVREATADGALAGEVAAAVQHQAHARRQEILLECRQLPARIASLADEVRRLVETMTGLTGSTRRDLETRLQQVDEERTRCEARLVASNRDLASLDGLEVDAAWVASCLADFSKVWDHLTPDNRGRLVRAVIQRVEVNEPENTVTIVIIDLAAELPRTTPPPEPTHEVAAS